MIVNLVRVPRREIMVGPIGRGLRMQAMLVPALAQRVMAMQVERSHLARDRPAPRKDETLYLPGSGFGSVDGGRHGRRRTGCAGPQPVR